MKYLKILIVAIVAIFTIGSAEAQQVRLRADLGGGRYYHHHHYYHHRYYRHQRWYYHD